MWEQSDIKLIIFLVLFYLISANNSVLNLNLSIFD